MQGMATRRQPEGGSPVERISEDRAAEEREMHARLVGHAGPDVDLDQRAAAAGTEGGHLWAGLPGTEAWPGGHHAPAVLRVVGQGPVDRDARLRHASHQRQVSLADPAAAECLPQRLVRLGGAGSEQETGRAGVETVCEAAAERVAELRGLREASRKE